MNLNKLLLASLSALCFTACSDDDENNLIIDDPTTYQGIFVLNQGNFYNNIIGSITNIDSEKGMAYQDVFMAANDRTIGDSPQAGIIYGSKMYVGVHISGTLEIMDKNTLKSEKTLTLTEREAGPRSLVAKDGKVYISLYDGYVARLDTLTMTIDSKIKVGPNPEEMAILGDYLYVTNSDGMNPNGSTDFSVSKINLSSFTEECKIPVIMNPTKIATNGEEVFVISMGNYTKDNPSTLQILNVNYDPTDKTSKGSLPLFEASMMAVRGNTIYCIKAPIFGSGGNYEYYTYDIANETKTAVTPQNISDPQAIGVNPETGHIYVSALTSTYGYSDPYIVNEYTSGWEFVKKYDAGIGAYAFVF